GLALGGWRGVRASSPSSRTSPACRWRCVDTGCHDVHAWLVLERLRLQNFRGFDDHVVPLRGLTIIVGANNAGKSSIVEALLLVVLVVTRFIRGTGAFAAIPEWLEHPDAYRGAQPALRGQGFEGHGPSTFHRYGDPPAMITAYFASGASVVVFI